MNISKYKYLKEKMPEVEPGKGKADGTGLNKEEQEKIEKKKEEDTLKASKKGCGTKEDKSKMEEEKYIAKFSDDNVKAVKGIVEKMKGMCNAEIKKDELAKLAEELEAAITIQPIPVATTEPAPVQEQKPVDTTPVEPVKVDVATPVVVEPTPEAVVEPVNEDASKQSEIEVAYKEVADQAVSKLKELEKLYNIEKEKNELLTRDNINLKESISKYTETAHVSLVDSTIQEISKFNELNEKELQSKKEHLSKMSDDALVIMKAEFEKINLSKMENEQLFETTPSQELDGKNVSKNANVESDNKVKDVMNHLRFR